MKLTAYECVTCGFVGMLTDEPTACCFCHGDTIKRCQFAVPEPCLELDAPESHRMISEADQELLGGLTVYTDGSALNGSLGPGGWAFAWEQNETVHARAGYSRKATNNQMELQAVIEAVEFFPAGCTMTLVSDSQYAVKGVNEWLAGWKSNGWRRNAGFSKTRKLKNAEFWKSIDQAMQKHNAVSLHWEPGHNGEPMNELCDSLCGEAARQQKEIQVSIPADQL